MKVLCVGDIVGEPGRKAFKAGLKIIKQSKPLDVIIANAENAAGGAGITEETAQEIFQSGADIITTGDHIWDQKQMIPVIGTIKNFLRPVNYPLFTPGVGSVIIEKHNLKIGVLQLQGRVFMKPLENPFSFAEKIVGQLRKETNIICVDVHAEATSEKLALAYFLKGKVSVIFGTHTHIPTADERIFPEGTAYITDIGMTGPLNSILGRKPEQIIERFIKQVPVKCEVAKGDMQIQGIIADINEKTGKAFSIERVHLIIQV